MLQKIVHISFTDILSILTYFFMELYFMGPVVRRLTALWLALRSMLCVFVQQLFLSTSLWQEEGNKFPFHAVRKINETSCRTWGLGDPTKLPKNAGELETCSETGEKNQNNRNKTNKTWNICRQNLNYFLLFRWSLSLKIVK